MYSGYKSLIRDIWFANIFSHFVDCFLTLSIVHNSLIHKFRLWWSLFICFRFSFVACVFGVITKDSLPNPVLQSFLLMFPSKSFVAFVLTFFILFWVNFYIWYRVRVQFHSAAHGYPVFSAPFIIKTVPMVLTPFKKIIILCMWWFSSELSVLVSCSLICSYARTTVLIPVAVS